MRFQILSHAGLLVEHNGFQLICDPWLIGSCYWRSWWNYPPVSSDLIRSLKPDAIYLTHIHWDHFHGPSLKLFPKTTQIIVPKGNFDRMKKDLHQMGYKNVTELAHGESLNLSNDFKITSYAFSIFLDSALVIEVNNNTILNANDSKFMGLPLQQILKNHPKIDFVLRSHSSANSRLSYEITDKPQTVVDDVSQYIANFAKFVTATGAKYAIPFASNHCHLHKEVFEFNKHIQTPYMVEKYFQDNRIVHPQVKVMLSGDSWSNDSGFHITSQDYFSNRPQRLEEYQEARKEPLEKFYALEEKMKVNLKDMEAYFQNFIPAIPFFVRRLFKGKNFLFVSQSGSENKYFIIDLWKKKVLELDQFPNDRSVIQIHTSALILKQCLKLDLFSHLSISKRVKYIVTSSDAKFMKLFNLCFNFYEYDYFPLHKILTKRSIHNWMLRWREIILYFQFLISYAIKRRLSFDDYLKVPKETSQANKGSQVS